MTTRRRAEPKTAQDLEATANVDPLRCEWRIGEARCFLTAGAVRSGKGFCDWHLFCQMRMAQAEDWEAFARFHGQSGTYCCELSHWPIDLVWKAAQGLQDLRQADRRECESRFCRHRMEFGNLGKVVPMMGTGEWPSDGDG